MIHVVPAGTVSAEQPAARHAVVAAASPGEDPLVRHGFARALTLNHLLPDVANADDSPAGADRPGHELVEWEGAVPGEPAEAFARAENAMNDMPVGDMDHGRRNRDAGRVRAMTQVLAHRGDTLLTVAAVAGDETAGTRRSYMLAVDERLGFVAHRRTHAYQLTMEKQ